MYSKIRFRDTAVSVYNKMSPNMGVVVGNRGLFFWVHCVLKFKDYL